MIKYSHVLTRDLQDITTFVVFSTIFAGGFTACIAIASFISHLVLTDTQGAFNSFSSVMNYSGIELWAPVRRLVELTNWTGLLGVFYFLARGTFIYAASLEQHEIPVSNVLNFPEKSLIVLPSQTKSVENW